MDLRKATRVTMTDGSVVAELWIKTAEGCPECGAVGLWVNPAGDCRICATGCRRGFELEGAVHSAAVNESLAQVIDQLAAAR